MNENAASIANAPAVLIVSQTDIRGPWVRRWMEDLDADPDYLYALYAPSPRKEDQEGFLDDSLEDAPASYDIRNGHASLDYMVVPGSPPPWAVGFCERFRKDTNALDNKLRGRVLAALEEVSELSWPFKPKGDTLAPLTGDLKGCWRYRIGDFRLILRPLLDRGRIDAVAFGARGSIYVE